MLLIKNNPLRVLCGLLETGNWLLVKLWFKNRRRAKDLPSRFFRTYMTLAGQEGWQCRSLQEVFGAKVNQRIVFEYLESPGINTPMDELAYLALMARIIQPKALFEIGTFRGRTALNFALNSPAEAEIFTMDLPPEERDSGKARATENDAAVIRASLTGIDYREKPGSEKIRQLFGNSLTFDFKPYYGRMDMVYVDGAHDYEAVKSDTLNALKMLKPGGWLMWDDFGYYGEYNGLMRAIFECVPQDQVIQVESAPLAIYQKPTTA